MIINIYYFVAKIVVFAIKESTVVSSNFSELLTIDRCQRGILLRKLYIKDVKNLKFLIIILYF